MTISRRLALSCLFLAGLAGCTEGQKTNPLSRAGAGTTAATTAPTSKSAPGLYQSPLQDPAKTGKDTPPEGR
jgi:hypothetical protein